MYRSLPFLIAIILLTASADAADLIVDGTTAQIVTPATYEIVRVINGGTLTVTGDQYIHAATFVVDVSSTVRGGVFNWPADSRNGKGTGGSNGGRGGGPGAYYPHPSVAAKYPLVNALRRVDVLHPGQNGALGPTVEFVCPGDIPCRPQTLPAGYFGAGASPVGIQAEHVELWGHVEANGFAAISHPSYVSCPYTPPPAELPYGGGGAGGTIALLARTLIIGPSATIASNGGNGGLFHGYAGGGGRIKVYYEAAVIDPSATFEAKAGTDRYHLPQQLYGQRAEDGTVYIKQVPDLDVLENPTADLNGDGFVDNNDLLLLSSQWQNAEPVPTHTPWPVPTYTLTNTPTLTPYYSPTPTNTPTPTWMPGLSDEDLIVESGTVTLSGFVQKRNVRISKGAALKTGQSLILWCDSFELNHGAIINGNATSSLTTGTPGKSGDWGFGASHGGEGYGLRPVYGTVDGLTIEPGSKGGDSADCIYYTRLGCPVRYFNSGTLGGAAIELVAATIRIEGKITAQGDPATGSTYCPGTNCCTAPPPGGGSGGGILLLADSLIIGPSAEISADGTSKIYGAGGGRVKLFYRENAEIPPTATISADGMEPGTIHIEKLD